MDGSYGSEKEACNKIELPFLIEKNQGGKNSDVKKKERKMR